MINPVTKDETGIITTRLDDMVRWGRKNSLWPLPFGGLAPDMMYPRRFPTMSIFAALAEPPER